MEFVQAVHFGLFLLAMELLRLEVRIVHLLLILVDSSYFLCVFWVWSWGFLFFWLSSEIGLVLHTNLLNCKWYQW